MSKSQYAPVTTAGSDTSCSGIPINISLSVTGFNSITAISLRLDYNPQRLTYNGSSNLNPLLNGLIVNNVNISDTLSKLMIVWSDLTPQTIDSGGVLLEVNITLLAGPASMIFNNDANNGGDCEYSDANGDPLIDVPTSDYYFNSQITSLDPATPDIWLDGDMLISSAPEGNQWYDQSGLIAGANGQTYTPLETGDYYDIVTLNGCSSSASNVIHVVVNGIDEKNKVTFNIYPNPAQNVLYVEIHLNSIMDCRLQISDIMGKVIKVIPEQRFEKGTGKIIVMTSDLPRGMYNLEIAYKNETGFTERNQKVIIDR